MSLARVRAGTSDAFRRCALGGPNKVRLPTRCCQELMSEESSSHRDNRDLVASGHHQADRTSSEVQAPFDG